MEQLIFLFQLVTEEKKRRERERERERGRKIVATSSKKIPESSSFDREDSSLITCFGKERL